MFGPRGLPSGETRPPWSTWVQDSGREHPRSDLVRPATQDDLGTQGGDCMIGEDVMAPSAETEQLRQQLLQAQRLSSMGALASSVAHEFNNILTTIINYAKLGLRAEGDTRARTEALERILKGSQRAATIVSSMLGFARN